MQLSLPTLQPDTCQRWFNGRTSFRLAQEPINPDHFAVEPIEFGVGKTFVETHHYSRSFSPCRQSYGLFFKPNALEPSRLVGVATFAPASNVNSITKYSGLPFSQGAELSRLVILDSVGGCGETWFLARALRQFKESHPECKIVISYSDPVARRNTDGTVTMPGHVGSIYQASNALFLGTASPKTQYLDPKTGLAYANRGLAKIRNNEVGREYAEKKLTEFSGAERMPDETPAAFVKRALAMLKPQRHPGNYCYAFPLAANRREKHAILALPTLRHYAQNAGPLPKRPYPLAA